MSEIEHVPTEVATMAMATDDARRLTERIRLTAHTARDSIEKLHTLVDQAKAGNAHAALGYSSWTAYLADVLGEEPLRLARDQRQELVGFLAGEGMSTRAIAPIVGTSDITVRRDLSGATNVAGESDDSPARPEDVDPDDPRTVELVVAGAMKFLADHPAKDITGVDGKIYRRLERAQSTSPKRRPLPDTARDLAHDVRKITIQLDRMAADERLPRNRDAVAGHLRFHLGRAIAAAQSLVDLLNEEALDS